MKKSTWMALMALSMTFVFFACDSDDDAPPTPTLDQYDVNFLNRSTRANRASIMLNRLAADSGTNPGVQQYATEMISSYEATQRTIDSIANAYSLQLPTMGDTVIAVFRDSLFVMSRGRDFDTSFVGYQMRLHDMYLVDLTDAATNAKNAAVKNYSSGRIPIINDFRTRGQTLFGTL